MGAHPREPLRPPNRQCCRIVRASCMAHHLHIRAHIDPDDRRSDHASYCTDHIPTAIVPIASKSSSSSPSPPTIPPNPLQRLQHNDRVPTYHLLQVSPSPSPTSLPPTPLSRENNIRTTIPIRTFSPPAFSSTASSSTMFRKTCFPHDYQSADCGNLSANGSFLFVRWW